MIAEQPVWRQDTLMPGTHTPPEACDVAVVGGGITGLVAGIELLRSGATVAIFDALDAGDGASGRAFGSIALGSSTSLAVLSARHGAAKGEQLWREASAAAESMERYLTERGIDAGYRRTGHIRLAVAPMHEAGLRADFTAWRRVLGRNDIYLLSGRELREQVPCGRFRLGLLDEGNATIDPYRYVASLLAEFSRLGGRYSARCAVSGMHRDGGGFDIVHGAGRSRSRDVLVATNGYTGALVPWLQRRIFPVGSYMIATAPLPSGLRDTFDARLRVHTTAYHLKNYFRLTPDGRLIFGGRANLAAGRDLAGIAAELRAAMLGYFPQLAPVGVTHVWGGNLGFTFDSMPHIGIRDGIHYAMGCCGRGLPIATMFGLRLAGALTGHGLTCEHAGVPMPSRWYYRRRPWFLPLAGAYYRWLDRRSDAALSP